MHRLKPYKKTLQFLALLVFLVGIGLITKAFRGL